MRSPMFYKPSIWRRILWVLSITIAVLAVAAVATYGVRLYLRYAGQVKVNENPTVTPLELNLDPGIDYKNIASDGALYFYSAESLKIMNASGKLAEDSSLKMNNPTAVIKGSHALFFDLRGHQAVVYNKAKRVNTITVDSAILLAAVNDKGYVILVTEGDLHKAAVRVFNPGSEEIFKWNSGNLSVISADIAESSKDITVSALNTDEGTIKNHIIMFNLTKEKPFTNDTYENVIYSVVRYSGSHLYAISSRDTVIYNGYGKSTGTALYEDRELIRYLLEDDRLTLIFSGSETALGSYAEIKNYNHRGEQTGSFTSQQEFDFIDAEDGIIALNTGRVISILDSRCQEKRQLNLNTDLRNLLFFGHKSRAVGITASGSVLIQTGA
ncbi:MAG: hypothetical protein E7402_01850 [Ruminococcaceae bacterium]|nr:hypothetical protein [Oscillospiraceae bacterium]